MSARSVPAPAGSLTPRIVAAAIGVVLVVAGGFALRASAFDLPVDQALNALHHGAVGAFTDAVYRYVGPVPAIVATAILTAVILLVRRDLRAASTFAVTIAVTWIPSAVVKVLVARPRPELSALTHPSAAQHDASYPSGHTVFLTALVVAAVVVTRSPALRRLWVVLGVVAIAVLILSLLTDGVHFPTDILASLVWSLTLAPLVAAVWQRIVRPRRGRRRLE